MSRTIRIQPLIAEAFAHFGDVLDASGMADKVINQGLCNRHHDRARLEFTSGRAGISVFDATPRSLPCSLDMVERHPDGSQAFLPMTAAAFLVVVAPDDGGAPGIPRAFRSAPGQGFNLLRGVWHGVLTPLGAPGICAVVDRIGPGPNLEEHWFPTPWTIID